MSERVPGKYRRKNDPYNGMETFLPSQKISQAKNILKNSEQNASQATKKQSAVTAEKLFRNSVKGKPAAQAVVKQFSKHGKKLSPFALIFVLMVVGIAALSTSQGLLGAQLTHIFTEITDLQFASNAKTKVRLTKRDLKKAKTSSEFSKRLKENGITVKGKKLEFKNKSYSAADLDEALLKDSDFQAAFTKSTYGRSSGQFDASAEKIYKKYGAVRRLFAESKIRNNADSQAVLRNTISQYTDGASGSISTATRQKSDNGDDIIERTGDDMSVNQIEGETPETKARNFVNGMAGKVDLGGNIACSALQVANLIAITAAANQTIKAIDYFLGIMEPISRTMDGDISPHNNDSLNLLTQKTTSEIEYTDTDGKVKTKKYTGSMLESSPLKNILSESKIDHKETKNFSPSIFTTSVLAALATDRAAVNTCTGIRASTALVSLVTTGMPGGQLINLSVGTIVRVFKRVAVAAGLMTILGGLIPHVAKIFFTPTFDAYTGVAAGNLFSYGGTQNNFRLAQQASGYMPSSAERMQEQNVNYQVALNQEAKIQRNTHHPLDINNPHTFLGSLATTVTPTLASATSLPSFVASFAQILNKSSSRLSSSASALGTYNTYTTDMSKCEDLPGTVCDAFGTNLPSMDFSLIEDDYDEEYYQAIVGASLTDDGEVIYNSNLGRFITFCVGRESPWGVSDANILSAMQTDGGIVLNNLPVVGDVLDLVNAAEDAQNQVWATGAACVNSKDNPDWDNEYRYYQRFVEDSRIDTAITGAENPVTAYQENYEKKHPVDNSYAGILARYSGLTKDQVRFALEIVNYSDYLANYHNNLQTKILLSETSESALSRNVPQDTNFFLSYSHEREYGPPRGSIRRCSPVTTGRADAALLSEMYVRKKINFGVTA